MNEARPRPHWLRRTIITVAVLAVLGVWGVVALGKLIAARHDLLVGKARAETAKGMQTPDDIKNERPVPALQEASVEFHKARRLLNSPLLIPARYVPVAGRQLQAARALAGAGAGAADAARDAIVDVHGLLGSDTGKGPGRLDRLRKVLAIAHTADKRLRALHYGPREALIGSLANGRTKLTDQVRRTLTSLDRGMAAGQAAVDLLSGQHRILLLVTNNAEMRSGSGMVLDLGLLQTNDGNVSLETVKSTQLYPVRLGAVPVPADLAAHWSWATPSRSWNEVLDSPRFDVTAPTAARMWEAAGQAPVDAVMAVDPVLLSEIVKVTGPVSADGLTLSGDQILPELLHDQYGRFASTAGVVARHEEMGDVARAAFNRFDAGGWSLTAMGEGLARAARGRHVLMWSRAPADEAGWEIGNISGVLTSRSLMVTVQNRGRNKLDWFLASSSTLTFSPQGNDTRVSAVLHLANSTPAGQAPEVVGQGSLVEQALLPGQQFKLGDYLAFVAVWLPGPARDVTIDGGPVLGIDGAEGPSYVIANQYVVPQGKTLDVTVRFTLPGRHGSLVVEPPARYPAMTWHEGSASWSADAQRMIAW